MTGTSRRSFLTRATAAYAGATFLPRRVFGANERLNVAFIGAGGRGDAAIRTLSREKEVRLAAFADVDETRAAGAYKAHPQVPRFKDFRALLDRLGGEIDAVVVSTPDHTHHVAAKSCLLAGKPVFVEKPLAHSIAEARELAALETSTGLACQMGNQGHSGGGIPMLDAWVKAGVFGEVRDLHAWSTAKWSLDDARPPAEPVPATLDWDLWLGPAAQVPHSSAYLPSKWRGWFAFGTGALGDWACHNMDAPYTVFGFDCPSRVDLESTGPKTLTFPVSAKITYTFPAADGRKEMKLAWYQGPTFQPPRPPELEPDRPFVQGGGGTLIVGSQATALMGSHAGTPRLIPEAKSKELASSLPKPNLKRSGHMANWLLAIRGTETCRSNFAYAARLTETMLFGNIALHVNRSLAIDPKTRAILGDPEAAALMQSPPARNGWKV
jgi:predicted dehydrogenase